MSGLSIQETNLTRIYHLPVTNQGEENMYDDIFSVLMVVSLGLIAGGGAGLLIGFLAGIRGTKWDGLSRNDKIITLSLVTACSAIAIGLLSWRFLLQ